MTSHQYKIARADEMKRSGGAAMCRNTLCAECMIKRCSRHPLQDHGRSQQDGGPGGAVAAGQCTCGPRVRVCVCGAARKKRSMEIHDNLVKQTLTQLQDSAKPVVSEASTRAYREEQAAARRRAEARAPRELSSAEQRMAGTALAGQVSLARSVMV